MPETSAVPDPLTAELAAIRRRAEQITSSHGAPGEEDSCDLNGETCTGHDAERLLGAVEAVLKGHTSEPVFLGADDCECPEPRSDDDHPQGAADVGTICLLSEVGQYCPACTEAVYDEEGPVGGEYVDASNCIVRPAIAGELLTEETGAPLAEEDLRVVVVRNGAVNPEWQRATVRITHMPSALTATAEARSELQAKADALTKLRGLVAQRALLTEDEPEDECEGAPDSEEDGDA